MQKPPQIQVFTYDEEEDEPQQTTTTEWCSKCQSYDLKVHDKVPGLKFCHSCGYFEEPTASEDKPALAGNRMFIPTAHKAFPPVYDEDDISVPFFASIPVDKEQEQHNKYEVTRSVAGGRVKHIRMKPGISPTEYNIHEDIEDKGQ